MNSKIGRNDPCPCGSGKKYKKCHMGRESELSGGVVSGSPVRVDAIRPGKVSPMRMVPDHIVKPSYADDGVPKKARLKTCVKTPEEIERMRKAGKAARTVLDTVLGAVRPGMTTEALDIIAHEKCIALGGYPSPLNYHGFPKSLCTSVNEVVCHGIPDDRRLKEGDIINCDVTIFIHGVHGDCSETVFVGEPDPASRKLVAVTYECMMEGIAAVKVGRSLNEIGKAIAPIAKRHRYGVVRDFAGHGIGEQFHHDPQIVHYPEPRQRQKVQAGMTFTVEPMINAGDWRCEVWTDNWTAVSVDGDRSAQFEHTLLVKEDGVELLTGGDGEPWFRRQLAAGWSS